MHSTVDWISKSDVLPDVLNVIMIKHSPVHLSSLLGTYCTITSVASPLLLNLLIFMTIHSVLVLNLPFCFSSNSS